MSAEIHDIDDLIGKVLAGEATAEERTRLEQWTALSADNAKYLSEIRAVFERAASNQVQLKFDTDAAWRRVQAKIRKGETPVRQLERPAYGQMFRIAAGIVIVLSVGILTYRWYNQPLQTFALQTGATVAQDTLPDGSTAFLNKKSSITYEYNPRKKTRRVKLKGESYFDVRHEEEKPFIIEAEEVLVRDIGTSFNVRAWPESDTVEVIVKTGEVQIYTAKNEGLNLKAGETGIYSKRLKEFSKLERADSNALAYKTGVLSFNNTELKSVIEKVNEIYNSKIKLGNPAIGTCRLTVTFHNDTIETIVDVIAETLKLTVTREKREITLNGAGCN